MGQCWEGHLGLLCPWLSPPEQGAAPLSTSFQGPSGTRPPVARVWGAHAETAQALESSSHLWALTPTPACQLLLSLGLGPQQSGSWWLTRHRARHVAGTQSVGIRRSLVPAPDGSPLPGARSLSRVGGVSPPFSASPPLPRPHSGAFCWLVREQWLWSVWVHVGGCVIFPDRHV